MKMNRITNEEYLGSSPFFAKPMLAAALSHPLWNDHKICDTYTMDGKPDLWKIAYYPIFQDGKTQEYYSEPRALIERPAKFKGEDGIDFREVPLRYLSKSSR